MVKFEVEKVSRKGNTSVGVIDVPESTTVDALTDLLQEKSTSWYTAAALVQGHPSAHCSKDEQVPTGVKV